MAINTVPDLATIEIDRRLGPNESPTNAYEQLQRFIAENADLGGCRIEHDPPFMQSVGMSDGHNRALAERLSAIVRNHVLKCELVGAPYGTDAAPISAAGVPTVVFGPSSIEQAHTADEFIDVEVLNIATDIFYRIACDGLC